MTDFDIDKLKSLPTPSPIGWEPGVVFDGGQGFVKTPLLEDEPSPEYIREIIKASRLDPDDIVVDWSAKARITSHIGADGNLVQCWYKLPIMQKPDRSFNVDELVASIGSTLNPPPGERSGWRTIMLSDQHIGKGKEAGGGSDLIARRWEQSVAQALDGAPFKGINLVFGGDTIEGYVSQNGKNIGECDLTLTEQIRVASKLVVSTIQQCMKAADEVIVSAVPGNHSESTRVSSVSMTDSHDLQIVSSAQQAVELAGLSSRCSFYYPDPATGDVTYRAGDTIYTVVHGHKFSGGPVNGAEKWWAGQITNDRPAAAGEILLYGHFHGFRAWNYTAKRWILSAPSLETQSTWFANATGATSLPGVLVFDAADGVPKNITVV